jgi:ribose 5-phosphate isomerase B
MSIEQIPPPEDGRRRLAFSADHAGYELKNYLAELATKAGYDVADHGVNDATSVDYPDFAGAVARAVAGGEADLGIVVCGTGIGVSMAANKVAGVRAAVVHDVFTAHYSREHNDANVLCLGARVVGYGVAETALAEFLATPFGEGRHAGRVAKIMSIEEQAHE